ARPDAYLLCDVARWSVAAYFFRCAPSFSHPVRHHAIDRRCGLGARRHAADRPGGRAGQHRYTRGFHRCVSGGDGAAGDAPGYAAAVPYAGNLAGGPARCAVGAGAYEWLAVRYLVAPADL